MCYSILKQCIWHGFRDIFLVGEMGNFSKKESREESVCVLSVCVVGLGWAGEDCQIGLRLPESCKQNLITITTMTTE